MCAFKPLAWRSNHNRSKNRHGGGRTIRGNETRGRSRPTNLSSTQHTPPPSSTDFWKIKPRGRCILICLMREQDMFPCSASIKYKKGQIYLKTNPLKRNKAGSFNLAKYYSLPWWLNCSQPSERGDSYTFKLSNFYTEIHFYAFCKSQRLSRVKNLMWLAHFRPGVARRPDHSVKFL